MVQQLLQQYNIAASKIGRIDVGTESQVDKAKSIKTFIMDLFQKENTDIDGKKFSKYFDLAGVDNINACYGGTAALLNSVNWIQSQSWDGRLALVVMSDISVYPAGPAR